MKRLKQYAVSLLLGVAIAASDYKALWTLVIIPIADVFWYALTGLVLRILLWSFLEALFTSRFRRRQETRLRWVLESLERLKARYWAHMSNWVRLPAALCAGSLLLAISLVPFKGDIVIILARMATARGIVHIAPGALRRAPQNYRQALCKAYVLLWLWTLTRIVGPRRALILYGELSYRRHLKNNTDRWKNNLLPGID